MTEKAKFVWMCMSSNNPCDIRRYGVTHNQAVSLVKNPKDWNLYKLVKVNKRKAK